jgi:hypothetical protein
MQKIIHISAGAAGAGPAHGIGRPANDVINPSHGVRNHFLTPPMP